MKIKYLSALPIIALLILSSASLVHAQSDVFTQNLYYGLQNNSQVTQLQEFLTSQGLYSGPITGNFYSLTLNAVRAFQVQEAITPAAGYFGPITMAAANEIADTGTNTSDKTTSETEANTSSPQDTTAPTVEWITPTSTAPSQTIYINGTGFQGGLTVEMGGYYLDTMQVEPNQITAVIPEDVASGEYHIFVINPNGDDSSLGSPITVTDSPNQTSAAPPVYTKTYPCFTETFVDGIPEITSNFPVGVNCN